MTKAPLDKDTKLFENPLTPETEMNELQCRIQGNVKVPDRRVRVDKSISTSQTVLAKTIEKNDKITVRNRLEDWLKTVIVAIEEFFRQA